MSQTPYDLMVPQGPFGKAVDRALAEEQAREIAYLATPEGQAESRETGQRYAALLAAKDAAGAFGAVLPVATAVEVIKALRGEPTRLSPDLLSRMVESALPEATA